MSGSSKKVFKLKLDHSINFKLIGISSHENDYRLVWAINNKLNMQFTKTDYLIVVSSKTKEKREFSRFSYSDEERYFTYTLISNSSPDGFLLPGIKNIDFLIKIQGEMNEDELKALNQKIKSVPVISASYILQPQKIKGINQLLEG